VQKSIALGYINADVAAVGQALEIDLKGTMLAANVVKLPFYRRSA
jgi:aminomethyltransferase